MSVGFSAEEEYLRLGMTPGGWDREAGTPPDPAPSAGKQDEITSARAQIGDAPEPPRADPPQQAGMKSITVHKPGPAGGEPRIDTADRGR